LEVKCDLESELDRGYQFVSREAVNPTWSSCLNCKADTIRMSLPSLAGSSEASLSETGRFDVRYHVDHAFREAMGGICLVPCFHRINSASEKREATVCKPRLKGMAREQLDSRIRLEIQLYGATRGLETHEVDARGEG
jgi:hypothetical protein